MSKQIHIENGVEYYDNYVISTKYLQHMEGEMLTLVELLALPEKQSEALKSKLRQNIWGNTMLKHGYLVWAEDMPRLHQFLRELDEEKTDHDTANQTKE